MLEFFESLFLLIIIGFILVYYLGEVFRVFPKTQIDTQVRQGYVECSQQVEPACCRQQVAPPHPRRLEASRDSRLLAVVTSRFSSLLMIVFSSALANSGSVRFFFA